MKGWMWGIFEGASPIFELFEDIFRGQYEAWYHRFSRARVVPKAFFFVLAAKFSKKIFQIEENKLLLLIHASGCFNDYPMRPFILELILTL